MNGPSTPIVIRPSRPTPSRRTTLLGWLGLPWLIAVLFGTDAVLELIGLPPGERPLPLGMLLVASALVPIALYVASPWLGRLPAMGWMLAKPQPKAVLDAEGIRLTLPERTDQDVAWSSVAALQPANSLRRTSALVGSEGQLLATVPWALAHPRGPGLVSRSLARQVVDIRPDRFALTGTDWAGMADGFTLREAAAPAPSAGDSVRRQRLLVGGLIAVTLSVSILAAIAWYASQI
jgi:hypothetical protein